MILDNQPLFEYIVQEMDFLPLEEQLEEVVSICVDIAIARWAKQMKKLENGGRHEGPV